MPGYSGGGGGSGDALTSNPLSQFAATTSAQLRGVISDETGTGAAVFATSPTLVTPILGTPTSGTLTNCTGLPTAGLVDDAVSNAKLANMAASTFKGRVTASTGDPEDMTVAQALTLLGLKPVATAPANGTTTTLTCTYTLTAGKNYRLKIKVVAAINANSYLLYLNGDTTAANYRRGLCGSSATHLDDSNPPAMTIDTADRIGVMAGDIALYGDYHMITLIQGSIRSANRAQAVAFWHNTATSITSVQITSSSANGIAAGSIIELWEMPS